MMNPDFNTITILGGGLLGGSLALALSSPSHSTNSPATTRLWVRRQESLATAAELGIPNPTTDLAAACADCDLLVLAVPVGSMPDLLAAAMAAGLPPSCLVTDVGSVKNLPHQSLKPLLEAHSVQFIGSHPMAGSEKNGLHAAHPALFEGAACLLTNDAKAPPQLTAALERFWQSVGCHTHWMSAPVHDELVARISHLPHILAAAGARVSLQDPSEGRFGGGGLRDTTRVASGNPSMWAEILVENRHAILPPLRQTIAELSVILATLESANHEAAHAWLEDAKILRDSLTHSK